MPQRLTEAQLNDPVIWHARPDFVSVDADQTTGQVLDSLRANPPQDRILYVYVIDSDRRLCGVLPVRNLLTTPADRGVREVMIQRPLAISAGASVIEACEFFTLYRLLAFPVIDAQRRIVGVVDVDMYTDELAELGGRNHDDLFQLIGVHLAQSRQRSSWQAFTGRFPWLLCNIAGGLLAAFLTGVYEVELQQAVSLALFMPVVLALAESVSIQSVSLALEVLHSRPPTWSTLLPKLRSELFTGLMMGVAAASVVGVVAWLWLGDPRVVGCLAGGIAVGVTAAALTGLAMPNVMRLWHVDPQIASGPLVLTIADMVTLLAYFSLARWLFGG